MQNKYQLKSHKYRMKKNPTKAERLFAMRLKKAGIEYKEQMILGFYILDFCIPDRLIAVEIDGNWHDNRKDYDERRDRFIKKCGLNVVRINNADVETVDLKIITRKRIKDVKRFRSALAKANSCRSTVIQKQVVN